MPKTKEIEEDDIPYLVYHDNWDHGHNGHGAKYSGNHCLWCRESELKLVESSITSEINIDSSGIKLTWG